MTDMLKKRVPYRNEKLSQAARDEPCTLRIPGICTGGGRTTVLAHSPYLEDGAGKGQKADDMFACNACVDCHDVLDGRRNDHPFDIVDIRDFFHVAMKRTQRRWIEKGLIG